MFDTKSDFALNKFDRDAIVCRSVTGVHIRLTRADFASEEEFLRWKVWSDGDYYDTEKDGRDFYDNGIPLDPRVDKLGAVPSIEAGILAALDAAEASAEQAQRTAVLMEQIKACLTETHDRYCQGRGHLESQRVPVHLRRSKKYFKFFPGRGRK